MTAIIVLGQGRSGTSAVAGVLHYLGVYMGKGPHLPTPDNARGSFEDVRFLDIHEKMIGGWKRPCISALKVDPYLLEYRALIEERKTHGLWGLKDPRLCFIFPFLAPLLDDDTKILFTQRGRSAMLKSAVATDAVYSLAEADEIYKRYADALRISKKHIPVGWAVETISYDELVSRPEETVQFIADWIGIPVTQMDRHRAIDFVSPSLRHWQ